MDKLCRVNLYDIEREYDEWFQDQNIPIRYFVCMDGGGVNYYTIAFQSSEHASAFIKHFGFHGQPSTWNEQDNANGLVPYIPDWRR